MKNSPLNRTFKTVFIAFLKEFFPCNKFVININKCKTYQEINNVLIDFKDVIADALDISNECGECQERDDRIYDLEERVSDLEEHEVDTTRLIDKMKLDCFIKNHQKFSLEHFTKLMES